MRTAPSDAYFNTVAVIVPVLFLAGAVETRFSLPARQDRSAIQEERESTTRKRVASLVAFLLAGSVGELACLLALYEGGVHPRLAWVGAAAIACQALLLSILLAQRATDDLEVSDVAARTGRLLVKAASWCAYGLAGAAVGGLLTSVLGYILSHF